MPVQLLQRKAEDKDPFHRVGGEIPRQTLAPQRGDLCGIAGERHIDRKRQRRQHRDEPRRESPRQRQAGDAAEREQHQRFRKELADHFSSKRFVILFLLVAQLITGIVMANALYRIFRPLGLLNSVQGLILADSTLAVE